MKNNHEKQKIIYILGAGHSGSTLLGMMLSAHSQVQGGGELKNFQKLIEQPHLFDRPTHTCSCGELIAKCPFWSPVKNQFIQSAVPTCRQALWQARKRIEHEQLTNSSSDL